MSITTREQLHRTGPGAAPSGPGSEPGTRIGLTAYQRDIWTGSARFPGLPSFNVSAHTRLVGELDVDLLVHCVRRMLAANDALRLRFGLDEGTPYQWVDEQPPDVEFIDHSGAEDPEAACRTWMEQTALAPLDLTSGPFTRAAVIRENEFSHYMFLRSHHIVVDATGMFLAGAQVVADYLSMSTSGAFYERPDTSFVEHIGAEQQYRASQEWQDDRSFWRAELDGAAPVQLARFGSTPDFSELAVLDRYTFTIERAAVDRIRQREQSLYAHFLAAVATYLARVLSTDEVLIGIPFGNRRTSEEKGQIGNFANTLPCRIRIDDQTTMGELVANVHRQIQQAKPHQRFALGDLLRELAPGDAASRQLFDVTVAYNRLPDVKKLIENIDEAEVWPHGYGTGALAIGIRELSHEDDLVVHLDYATNVFDEDFPIESAARHIKTLLLAGLNDPEAALSTLAMLSTEEEDELVRARNATEAPFRDDVTIHGLFEEQVARTPDRAAVRGGDGTEVSYRVLDARANRVAHALRSRGVEAEDRVAVAIERSTELLIAILGVLKAGAAYVPIDPGYPQERIRYMVADSAAKLVLVAGPAAVATAVADCPLLDVKTLHAEPSTAPRSRANARSLAYVIYTSGSTGRPKGVMVEHRSVVNRLAWMQKCHPLGPADVVLHKTPCSFDVSVWELFWWGIEGASLALLGVGGEKDPAELLDAIERQAVTVMHFVPSMLGPFLDLLSRSPELVARARSLRAVFCSGEALLPHQVEQFNRIFAVGRHPAPRLVNLYGPTEATVDVSYFECPSGTGSAVGIVPIGKPIDNTRLYVLGRNGQPQALGAAGELCIAGVGLARGYLGRDQLTSEKFVDDPFVPGSLMYRTGDLARWLASGGLAFLGRIDRQVKIRGNRVELGEAESALMAVPGVRDVIVVDVSSPDRDTYLVAYYTAEEEVEPAGFRAHAARVLPDFMIPAHFVRVEEIPLTPSGKADRKSLPLPHTLQTADHVAPRTDAERLLAAVWGEVLGLESVGVHDNYFALGGDSILVLRVVAGAERAGWRVQARDALRYPTIAELAPHAEPVADVARVDLEPFDLVSAIDQAKLAHVVDAFPASRLQLGMLFHSRSHDHSTLYHDVFRYTLRIPWNEAAWREAFMALVRRHPALRTSFELADLSEPMQLIHEEVPSALAVSDLRGLADEAAEARIQEHIEQQRRREYSFHTPPLYELHVFRTQVVEVVFSFHHAILDGWSVASLVAELLQDYLHGFGAPVGPVPDAALPSPAGHVREERLALAAAPSRQYWIDRLADAPPTALSNLRAHERHADGEPNSRYVQVPETLDRAVRDHAREAGVPLKAVLLAAHLAAVRMFTGESDVTTGVIGHGREERDHAERVAGMFLNTLPLRVDTASLNWRGLIDAVVEREREAWPHRRYPLSEIQAELGRPVAETAFNFVHFHVADAILDVPEFELIDIQVREETNFPLLVNAIADPRDDRLWLRIDADGQSVTASQAEAFAEAMVAIARQIVVDPDGAIDFGFLAPAPPPAHPGRRKFEPVASRFARQARLTPGAPAIVHGPRRWTYADLDELATRTARRLVALGAPAGVRIGLAVDRSPELIALVIGIAKAGAACVPLDVSYPPARLHDMVDQAKPFAIVAGPGHEHVGGEHRCLSVDELLAPDPRTPESDALAGAPATAPEDTAYVLFTSGSTGRPKGVAMPHAALANLVDWQLQATTGRVQSAGEPDAARSPHTLQFAPLSFDVAFQEIYSTLCGGGTLHLVSDDQRREVAALLRMLDREAVERVFLPYVALQQFAQASQALAIAPSRLRLLISSGEQLRVTPEIRAFCDAIGDVVLENQYGPTETHVVTHFTMTGDPKSFPELPPIGMPIDGAEVLVLDADLRLVPDGVVGEIYVGGVCLADGYERRPDLTAERFLPDPFGRPHRRLYRTGDLGRRLAGGDVVHEGRADRQIKVRGFRVEPAEVELAILEGRSSTIREAAVVAVHPGNSEDAVLVAYLVGAADAVDIDRLHRDLRATLPAHMVPARFEWLATMPTTPSGKRADDELARRPLRAPEVPSADGRPQTDIERRLAAIVAEVLGVPSVGVHDDFFLLGGTSLSAMRLVVTVEKRFGVTISMAAFAASPTAASIARELAAREAKVAFDPVVPLRPMRRPVFLVHPIGGNVLCYRSVAHHVAPDQPVYALQAAGIEPGTEPLETIPDIARSYMEAIVRLQPTGPYQIGGWSLGGLIAYELARQLRLAGRRVDRLILIDTMIARPGRGFECNDEMMYELFMWELLATNRAGDMPLESLPAGLDGDEAMLEFILGRAVQAGVLPAGASPSAVRRLFSVFKTSWQAAAAYQPEPSDQDLVLLRARAPLPDLLRPAHDAAGSLHHDATNGWSELARGRLDVIEIPGNHLTIMEEPHVRVVASEIGRLVGVAPNRGPATEVVA